MPEKTLKMPAIGEFVRHTGKLVAIETIPPPPQPPPEQDYIFEEITARCELRLGKEVIKHLETLNDFYGLETSVGTAINETQAYAAARKLTPVSELEAVVVRVVHQFRTRPTGREGPYSNGYLEFEPLKWGSQRALPKDVETIAWSSKCPTK